MARVREDGIGCGNELTEKEGSEETRARPWCGHRKSKHGAGLGLYSPCRCVGGHHRHHWARLQTVVWCTEACAGVCGVDCWSSYTAASVGTRGERVCLRDS